MASGYGLGGASKDKKVFKALAGKLLSGSPTQDINYHNYDLRQRSRLLYMTEPIAGSLINQQRNNVIGMGLYVKPRIDYKFLGISKEYAEVLQDHYEREFNMWCEDKYSCDATGVNDFYSLQQVAFVSWLLSGDTFCLFKSKKATPVRPYSLRLHLIEADRCSTPNTYARGGQTGRNVDNDNLIYDGVEVDKDSMVVAYHILNKNPHDLFSVDNKPMQWVRVKAIGDETGLPNILHIMNTERPEQYRGVPFLAKIVEPLLQIKRYREAELMSAVIQTFFTVFVTNNPDLDGSPRMNEVTEPEGSEVTDRSDEYEMGVGNINFLDEGEDVKFAQPTHPNSGFGTFCEVVIQHIASCLGEPKEVVLMAFNSSYSASRAALQEAWKTFKMFRKWFINDFCQPVYERWFTEAVAIGRIEAPSFFNDPQIRRAYVSAQWIGQAQGMLDPTKDISSAVLAIQNNLTTGEEEAFKLFGNDIYENIAQRSREVKLATEAGLALIPNDDSKGNTEEENED